MPRLNKWSALIALVLLLFGTVTVAYAQLEESHVYGVVFLDGNMNGVWDRGETGISGVTVTLRSGSTTINLTSASGNACTLLDPAAASPCGGTWGLVPAGPPGTTWEVTVTPPVGYVVTSANPQMKPILEDVAASTGLSGVLQFGLAPSGAGGAGAQPPAAPPAAGGALYGLYTAALLLVGGASVLVGSRIRK